ncbi:MAG: hypothetical protein COA36_09875 [Desulfotalea sp.]|nr:MAG: hypothetical protein COA36_09875 [Desulfotalea sp.]
MITFTERRKHIRVSFTQPQMPVCDILNVQDCNANIIHCAICDISMGGVRLSLDEAEGIAIGDNLILINVKKTARQEDFLISGDARLEVDWLSRSKGQSPTSLGCRIIDISENVHNTFANFVLQKLRCGH